jgi:hypothetical protein
VAFPYTRSRVSYATFILSPLNDTYNTDNLNACTYQSFITMHSVKPSPSSTHRIPPSPTPSAPPPFHHTPSLTNFRTIGGWPISSTTHVRHNVIYRGSDTTHITPPGIQALTALNIRTDVDIRSASQITKLGYRDLGDWGIERLWCPVFSEENQGDAERRYELYASEDVDVSFRDVSCKRCDVQANGDRTS